MCGCEKHTDKSAPCTCICDSHRNFEAARDLAMSRYHAIQSLERELAEVEETRERWMSRALEAEERAKAAERKLAEVQAVLADEWARGRVLPRMVGAEDQARVRAIAAIINPQEVESDE